MWVLENGLPEWPESLERGMSVPVARWAGAEWGAVFQLQWNWYEDDPDDDYIATEVQVLRRTSAGWEASDGSGGSNWHTNDGSRAFVRPDLPERAAFLGGLHWSGGAEWSGGAMDGVAGTAARYVTLRTAGGEETHAIDNDLGIVIGAFDGSRPATLIVTTGDGEVVATQQFTPWS